MESAALRELKEESGISNVANTKYLGSWESAFKISIGTLSFVK
ncbi:NUDIX domain-containing protein [Vibrio parahaemolyticus]